MRDTRRRGQDGRILVTGPEAGLRPANYAEGVEARGYRRERQQREYEQRERAEFGRLLRDVESAPLHDRKEAAEHFLEIMRHQPHLVGERVGWLLDGNYGYGAGEAAKKVAANKRMNRPAWMTHVVGALEWQCPAKMAMAAWHKLTPAQKKALDVAVNREISEWDAEHKPAKAKKHRYKRGAEAT